MTMRSGVWMGRGTTAADRRRQREGVTKRNRCVCVWGGRRGKG